LTTRLYYNDSLLFRFTATVVETGIRDGRHFVVLDQTAFYPTSGGQPHDLGKLGGRSVIDVADRDDDGAVLHLVDDAIAVGQIVEGEIDRARRLDHMQQHTGQHVLSAAFVRVFDVPTVSVHLGTDSSTIDLSGDLDAVAITRAEDEANRIVWDDRLVTVRFVTDEEAMRLPLRKEPSRTGTLRLVQVQDFDLSACGGTHVPRTGAIGIIAVTGWERYKGGTRISFVCGGRALGTFRCLRDAATTASRLLSVQTAELPDAVARLQADARDLRLHARALGDELATFQAAALRREAADVNGLRILARVLERDQAALKALAQAIAADGGPAVLLVSAARPSAIVVARGGQQALDAGAVLKAIVARFGGKGGGRPELAQGGGLDADPEAVRQFGVSLLSGG
jgi:alanyl-tRNA synthetase